jgi:transcriptional regulator with XRE-family HTH domain
METTDSILGLSRRNQTSSPEERLVFARGLIRERLRKGLSVKRMSELSGIHDSSIYKLEGGLVMPTTRTILKLAEALSCPPGSFFKADRRNRKVVPGP